MTLILTQMTFGPDPSDPRDLLALTHVTLDNDSQTIPDVQFHCMSCSDNYPVVGMDYFYKIKSQ